MSDDLAEVAAELRRLDSRLRGAPERVVAGAAVHVRATVQQLAAAAQGIEERDAPTEPAWRAVPPVPESAFADQLAVVGHDVLAAARADGTAPDLAVWSPDGRTSLDAVVAAVAARLRDLRSAL